MDLYLTSRALYSVTTHNEQNKYKQETVFTKTNIILFTNTAGNLLHVIQSNDLNNELFTQHSKYICCYILPPSFIWESYNFHDGYYYWTFYQIYKWFIIPVYIFKKKEIK